ncbi:MAG: uridine diphosphate-N-acetylglucosamine-binding protein YvcK [Actinomycetota bacterium]|nr:uridine diphosphate-N-acetylglucosamine-binding protein YvcK [Actinomycetota bacterium]
MTEPAVVALGGGHGLAASLSALRHVTSRLTAVVTVADNGGSSGRLRRELGVLPPGDLRMALAALCGDDGWGRTWESALQHRFRSEGDLHDHAVGNLLIVALWELLETSGAPDAHVAGLDWVARLLDARGRVLPMSAVPLDVVAQVRGVDPGRPDAVEQVRGQVEVATTVGQVQSIGLDPPDPPASDEAVAAVRDADCVVIGPGSWFTSVLVHLLVPDLSSAVHETSARRVLTLNLAPQPGETDGLSPEAHLAALAAHAPDLRIDVVLTDESVAAAAAELPAAVQRLGARLVLADVASVDDPARHDVLRLAAAYQEICSTVD